LRKTALGIPEGRKLIMLHFNAERAGVVATEVDVQKVWQNFQAQRRTRERKDRSVLLSAFPRTPSTKLPSWFPPLLLKVPIPNP
jgi:hypothetical protein